MRAGIFTTTIEKITSYAGDTRNFRLAFDQETAFEFDAGQFLNVLLPENEEGKKLKRPYSIASPPSWNGYLDLCLKLIPGGTATKYFWSLKEGDKVEIQGPLGRFVVKTPLPETAIFVSTGTGIAPFRSMIHELLLTNTDCEILNIFGNRYENEIPYKDEFEELTQKHSRFKNVFTVSRPKNWGGETEYVQFMLKKHCSDAQNKHLYICGLTNMITEVEKQALEIGFSKDQIHYEKYD